jgi:hypothetical protein
MGSDSGEDRRLIRQNSGQYAPVFSGRVAAQQSLRLLALGRGGREVGGMQYPYNFLAFDGIMAHLAAENQGQNIADLGIVSITGNSADKSRDDDLHQVINYEWNRCWASANVPNSWIQFDFGLHQVLVTHYSIKTYPLGPGYSHLKSWVLEGYDPSGNWFDIDVRDDSSDLNGKSKVATFQCTNTNDAQIGRVRQTGSNHNGDDYLRLTNIEFFGAFFE